MFHAINIKVAQQSFIIIYLWCYFGGIFSVFSEKSLSYCVVYNRDDILMEKALN